MAGNGAAVGRHVVGDGRRGRAHVQLVARHALHAQRRGLGTLFHLQALVLGFQAARFGHRLRSSWCTAGVTGTACAPDTGAPSPPAAAPGSGHPGTSVRSATRITALRARGLAATSAPPGDAGDGLQAHGLGRGERRAAVEHLFRMLGDELLDDAIFQRMKADHHQAAARFASTRRLAPSACCSSSQARR